MSLNVKSHKQKMVSYSAFGAEMIATEDLEDHSFDFKCSYKAIFPSMKLKNAILVNSEGLHDTIKMLQEQK